MKIIKYNSLDLFKFIMAIVVIAIHTNPFDKCDIRIANEFVMIIEDLAVPFFFMTSGFLLVKKWGDTVEERKNRVDKMIISTIKIYTIWTLISLPLSIYGYVGSGNSLLGCLLSYFKYFLFVGKLYNSYHLWYLLALIYAFVIIRVMLNRNQNVLCMLRVGVILYVIYLAFFYLEQINVNISLVKNIIKIYEFIFNKGGVWSGMLYVTIGMYVAQSEKHFDLRISIIVLIVGIVVRQLVLNEVGVIISSTMLFVSVLEIKLPESEKYKTLRDLSKYIYLTHLICFSIYTAMIGDLNKLGLDSFVATLTLALICSSVIVKLNNRKNSKAYIC